MRNIKFSKTDNAAIIDVYEDTTFLAGHLVMGQANFSYNDADNQFDIINKDFRAGYNTVNQKIWINNVDVTATGAKAICTNLVNNIFNNNSTVLTA